MLTTELIHPEILKAVSLCGHGDKILISDGNYPLASKSGDAQKIYLGLAKDCPTATKVLEVLKTVLNFEKAEVMDPEGGETPEILAEFQALLPEAEFASYSRWDFYDECCKTAVKVAVMSGESRTFANILLTVGVA